MKTHDKLSLALLKNISTRAWNKDICWSIGLGILIDPKSGHGMYFIELELLTLPGNDCFIGLSTKIISGFTGLSSMKHSVNTKFPNHTAHAIRKSWVQISVIDPFTSVSAPGKIQSTRGLLLSAAKINLMAVVSLVSIVFSRHLAIVLDFL